MLWKIHTPIYWKASVQVCICASTEAGQKSHIFNHLQNLVNTVENLSDYGDKKEVVAADKGTENVKGKMWLSGERHGKQNKFKLSKF